MGCRGEKRQILDLKLLFGWKTEASDYEKLLPKEENEKRQKLEEGSEKKGNKSGKHGNFVPS